jgi:hypothetical protein
MKFQSVLPTAGNGFLATRDNWVIGFAAYECTRILFGPTGVVENERGTAWRLLIAAFWDCANSATSMALLWRRWPN